MTREGFKNDCYHAAASGGRLGGKHWAGRSGRVILQGVPSFCAQLQTCAAAQKKVNVGCTRREDDCRSNLGVSGSILGKTYPVAASPTDRFSWKGADKRLQSSLAGG